MIAYGIATSLSDVNSAGSIWSMPGLNSVYANIPRSWVFYLLLNMRLEAITRIIKDLLPKAPLGLLLPLFYT
ncbi:MAG: hypothetical protein RE468_10120 [Acidithiobacillus caldus]|uniref:hypothetical protein n=1 Tax=Acidithiobacillus caldus TaxID=33059 RepID=UPI002815E524|nr:hypothetical protein [Acidithiobacillus caldus]WMT46249.1 MAG: hypothetical protein RE468_10120 [Acidithiobacillus caldus]